MEKEKGKLRMMKNCEERERLIETLRICKNTDMEKERRTAEMLIKLGELEQDPYSLAFGHIYLADYFILRRQHDDCLQNLKIGISISEDNEFTDLLPFAYTIAGLYHNSRFDEVTALQYYLDAYQIAKQNEDIHEQMVLLNDISAMFSDKDDYEDALTYIKRAYELFLKKGTGISTHADLVVILNLVQLYLQNNQKEQAKDIYLDYIPLLRAKGKEDLTLHVILLCEIYLSEAFDHREHINQIADYFANSNLHQHPNRSMYFSFYNDILKVLLRAKDKERSELFLQFLGEICREDDIEQQLKLHLSWINFAETFHMEQSLLLSYKQYYLLQKMVADITNKTKTESMKEKIYIHRLIEEKEKITTEKQILEDKIKIDELTRVFNRSYFNTLSSYMQTNPDVDSIGFVITDVDFFKEYNDYYGHYQGDHLLQTIAHILDEAGDSRFFTARYGGDEFITLCVNTREEEVEEYLTRIYKTMKLQAIEHKASRYQIATISSGYAVFAKDANFSYEAAITLADAALYKAKAEGKNGYRKY